MRIASLLAEIAITAAAAFLAAAATTLLWSLGADGAAVADLATSARLAVGLGVALPITRRLSTHWAGKDCAQRRGA